MPTSRSLLVACVLAVAVSAASPAAQTGSRLTIAAASDLQTVMPVLVSGFERRTGIKPAITFGSSGNFFAQIQNGAPFDLFFSADADYPRKLAAAGHVDSGSIYDYATGRLVIWTRVARLDPARGLELLRDPQVRRIAIANPATAPYGRAAVAAMRSAGVYDAVQPKLVFGENVSQAAQLAESGNADVALIGHGLAVDQRLKSVGRFADVPTRLHPPIVQALAIVARSTNKAAAQAFVEYVKSDDARETLRGFGFDVPPAR